jgi:multidrug efflux pump subunit AcrA (membrane-fusion protein)
MEMMQNQGELSMIKARKIFGILLLAASVAGAQAQSAASQAAPKPAKAPHKTQRQLELDLEQLNEKYEQLEAEIAEMKADAQRREAELQAANKTAKAAQKETEEAAQQQRLRAESNLELVAKQDAAVASLQSAVTDLKGSSASLADTIQTEQKRAAAPEAIPFMGITLKPGGFLAGETVDRQRGIGGDINTQFSGIPFSGQSAGRLSEFNASGRQSRVSLLAQGKLSQGVTLRGYFEGDFLSAGTTSNDNQSNSYTFRMRQAWAQSELKSGWTFTAGQMWSLATEYRSGLTNTKEATPLTIDAQYNVGFTWERQFGFRVTKKIDDKLWAGVSVEEAQTLNLGGHNLPALVYQQAGNSGGLYNSGANYSFNLVPDFIGKIAYQPGFGHFELFAVGRFFRARAFPNGIPMLTTTPWGPTNQSTTGAFTTKTAGGGLGLNARVPVFARRLEIGVHGMAGDGLGRYGTSTLSDATAHPDGTLELLTSGSALGSLEWHATKRLDLYAYYGGEFDKRAFYNTGYFVTTTPTSVYQPPLGQPVVGGYGAPTNIMIGCNIEVLPASSANGGGDVPGSAVGCTADNRNIQEGTLGEWYRFYKGPKGTFQMGLQYSYVVRHTWQGVGLSANPLTGAAAIPGSPKAIDNMWFTSFRYYLPQ